MRWFENCCGDGRTNGRSLRSRPTARAKALSQRRSGSILEMQIIKHHILKVNPLCAPKLVLGHTLFLGDIVVHGSWTDLKILFSRDMGTQVQRAKKRGCTWPPGMSWLVLRTPESSPGCAHGLPITPAGNTCSSTSVPFGLRDAALSHLVKIFPSSSLCCFSAYRSAVNLEAAFMNFSSSAAWGPCCRGWL